MRINRSGSHTQSALDVSKYEENIASFTKYNISRKSNTVRDNNTSYSDVLDDIQISKTPIFEKIIDFERDITYLRSLVIKDHIYNIFKMNIIIGKLSEAIESIEKNEFDSFSLKIKDNINSEDSDIVEIGHSMAIFTSQPSNEDLETSLDYLEEIKDDLYIVLKANSLIKYRNGFQKLVDNMHEKIKQIAKDILDTESTEENMLG